MTDPVSDAMPSVLFVCVKNGGKSQMAAALMRHAAGGEIQVFSAGTEPGSALNAESAASVRDVGASMDGETPKPIDPEVLRSVNRVVVIGEAHVEPVEEMSGNIEVWDVDEPSLRGLEGVERMVLIREDIAARVAALRAELLGGQPDSLS